MSLGAPTLQKLFEQKYVAQALDEQVDDISNYDYLSGRNIIYEIQNDISRKERNAVSGQIYGTIFS